MSKLPVKKAMMNAPGKPVIKGMMAFLKTCLYNTAFSDKEFAAILNHLAKGNVFEKAKTLRDRLHLNRDNGESFYVRFFNHEEWQQNLYQVTNQVTQEGSYKNRYDVTILVNGLPLVQIELKRRGLELKEAFNQINRYKRHSFWSNSGLFQYVQLFVIRGETHPISISGRRNIYRIAHCPAGIIKIK